MESRMLRGLAAALILITFPSAIRPLGAQEFEGVVRQRTISVSLDALADAGFEVSPTLFDISIEEILALRGRLEADGSMTVSESEILIKDRRMRMDASDEEGPGYAMIDLDAGVTRMASPEEGVYIEITRADMEQLESFGDEFGDARPEITETGQTRIVNGMNATAFDVVSDEGESRIWVSDDDPALTRSFRELVEQMSEMSMDEAADPQVMLLEYGVPVLVQALDYDMYSIEEVLSVDRRSVRDEAFEMPSGLQRMTMEDMMGGMMGSGGGGGVEADMPGGILGLSEMESPPAWVEYEVSGAWDSAGREDDVVMCSNTEDGFLARSLGDVIIDLEADGPGEGRQEMSVYVSGETGGRFEGRGTMTVRPTGEESFGFPIYEVEFEGSGLEASDGGTLAVSGRLACAAM